MSIDVFAVQTEELYGDFWTDGEKKKEKKWKNTWIMK